MFNGVLLVEMGTDRQQCLSILLWEKYEMCHVCFPFVTEYKSKTGRRQRYCYRT